MADTTCGAVSVYSEDGKESYTVCQAPANHEPGRHDYQPAPKGFKLPTEES